MLVEIGITISLLLAVLLALKKDKWKADKILLIWFIVNAIHLWLFRMEKSEYRLQFSHIGTSLAYLHGPFLFLYVAAFTDRLPKKLIAYILHFTPFFLLLLYFTPYFILPVQNKENVSEEMLRYLSGYYNWHILLVMLSGYTYIILSFITMLKHASNIKEQYASLTKVNIRWLYGFILSMTVIWTIIPFGSSVFLFSFVALDTSLRGIVGIMYTSSFTNNIEYHRIPSLEKKNEDKYLKSGLDTLKKQQLLQDLNKLIAEDKVYKNPEITLTLLAVKLNIHANYLSQVLNEELKLSFYDYLNTLRIKEFKELVKNPDNNKYSILALAYESGFNSKASFNRNFKKHEGITPSEFVKRIDKMK